jgi:hypothetical protein
MCRPIVDNLDRWIGKLDRVCGKQRTCNCAKRERCRKNDNPRDHFHNANSFLFWMLGIVPTVVRLQDSDEIRKNVNAIRPTVRPEILNQLMEVFI